MAVYTLMVWRYYCACRMVTADSKSAVYHSKKREREREEKRRKKKLKK
jgi:hypothetical protein